MAYVYNLEFGAYKISFTDGAKNPLYYIKKKYTCSNSELKVYGGLGNSKLLVCVGREVEYKYEQVSKEEFINSDIKYNSYLECLNSDKIQGDLFYIDSNGNLNPYYDSTISSDLSIYSNLISQISLPQKVHNDIRQKIDSKIVLTLDP